MTAISKGSPEPPSPTDLPTLTEIHVDGMHCNHCTQTIRKALETLGVTNITIDIGTSSALINPQALPIERITEALTKAGYPAHLVSPKNRAAAPDHSLEIKLVIALVCTAPLLGHMLLPFPILHSHHVQLALAIPVVALGISHFGKSAIRSLRQKIANMDLLIVIGIISAFGYSLFGTISGLGDDYLFYETAASITLFVLFGNFLERRSLKRTSAAVEELARLQPEFANRINAAGTVERVPSVALHVNDTLLIKDGEKVPVDCQITDGVITVDESMVTGESLPLTKKDRDRLIGGSIVKDGSAHAIAVAVGDQTVLSSIIRLVRTATSQKPAIEKLGDQVSSVFVPVVLAIALFTFVAGGLLFDLPFQQALLRSIAVLVIACPCAMGLATPTAVTVGIGRAAKEGALIKGGAALERLAHIETVIFDKTGTLTTGKLSLDEISIAAGNRETALRIIGTMESHSNHPIAAVVSAALPAFDPFPLREISEDKGRGLRASDAEGNNYLLGSAAFTAQLEQAGDIFLTKNGSLIASLRIGDQIKPEAKEICDRLRTSGFKVVIISGDSQPKVSAAARQLGVTEFYAEQLPAQKLELTKKLSAEMRTCFIGDGINDAPALAQASVGISLSGATQVAIQTADIILLDGKLRRLPELLALSRLTFKTIKENLFWAFFYNSLAIPLAAFGYLTPLVAALTMAFSDVIVIGNSLRLKVRASEISK